MYIVGCFYRTQYSAKNKITLAQKPKLCGLLLNLITRSVFILCQTMSLIHYFFTR